jgi:hypothetical protein
VPTEPGATTAVSQGDPGGRRAVQIDAPRNSQVVCSRDIGRDLFAITPDDNGDSPNNRGIWIAAAGTVGILNEAEATVSLGSLPVGTYVPVAIRRVRSTGTTATAVSCCPPLPRPAPLFPFPDWNVRRLGPVRVPLARFSEHTVGALNALVLL